MDKRGSNLLVGSRYIKYNGETQGSMHNNKNAKR